MAAGAKEPIVSKPQASGSDRRRQLIRILKAAGILAACAAWLYLVIQSWSGAFYGFRLPTGTWADLLPKKIDCTAARLYLSQAGFVFLAFYLTVLVPDLLRRFFPGNKRLKRICSAASVPLLLFGALCMVSCILQTGHPLRAAVRSLFGSAGVLFLARTNMLLVPVCLGLILATWLVPVAVRYLRGPACSRRQFPRTVGKTAAFYGLLIALGFLLTCASACMVAVLHTAAPSAYQFMQRFLNGNASRTAEAFVSICLAPVMEEAAFRGLILHHSKRRLPFAAALFFSALCFGLWHRNLGQFVYTFFVGLLWGVVYNATGSIRHIIVLHFAMNLFAVAAFCSRSTDVFGKLTVCPAIGGFLTKLPLIPAILLFLVILLLVLFVLELVLRQTDGRDRLMIKTLRRVKGFFDSARKRGLRSE